MKFVMTGYRICGKQAESANLVKYHPFNCHISKVTKAIWHIIKVGRDIMAASILRKFGEDWISIIEREQTVLIWTNIRN
jgi:hypothetical protein